MSGLLRGICRWPPWMYACVSGANLFGVLEAHDSERLRLKLPDLQFFPSRCSAGLPHVRGSGGGSQARVGVVRWREPLPKGGPEGAVVDSAADLQQEIGTPSGPAHLLRFVHSAVHQ